MSAKSIKLLLVRAVVTFVETAVAFLAVNNWDFHSDVVVAGAVGAGLSAVYNWARNQWPEIFSLGVVKK